MSLTSSPIIAGQADLGRDPLFTLWKHRQHVFIFTRAGKPIFSLHGEEEGLSPLFALFQVLLHMSDEEDGDERHGQPPLPQHTEAPDDVRQVIYYQPHSNTSSGGVDEQQALTLFFYVQGELMYVMAQRTVAPASHLGPLHACATPQTPYTSTAPPVASYCAAQLRHIHHFVLLVLPTINTLLVQQPSRDVMSIYTESDRAALRELIESYASRLTYAVGAMATLPIAVEKRRIVEGALLRSFRAAGDRAVAPPAQQLFSLLFYQDYLVAAVGPPELYAAPSSEADKVAPLALGSADASCGGLHVDDALLLYRYARSLVTRQVGEAWAPVCLPRFNGTGYLWCYAVNFSRHIRELRGECGLSVWPSLWAPKSGQDVLLLHISAAQDDFTSLKRCTQRFAASLYAPAVGDNFYYRLEEEMCYRTPAPLTELLGPLHTHPHSAANASLPSPSPSPASSSRAGGVPLWYALVLQNGDAKFVLADEATETHAAMNTAAAAVMRHFTCASADIRLLLECQPSPLLNLATLDDTKSFYQSVTRHQAQLRAIPPSASSPSLLLVRDSSTIAFALAQPTMATLTVLAQYFFSTKAPFEVPGSEDDEAASPRSDRSGRTSSGNHARSGHSDAVKNSRQGVSFSEWVEAVRALGVVELTVVFAAATPDVLVWYWVARVLFMAVQRRGRYVVRQLVGK